MRHSFRSRIVFFKNFAFPKIVLLMLGVSSVSLAQTTIHVPGDATTIQGAIDVASNGDTVLVAPGTYTENINFNGKAIAVTSGATSFAGATTTIIKAAGDGPVVQFTTNEPINAVLNGFTVQNGHLNNLSSTSNGAGIYVANASATVTNNVVTANTCGIVVGNGGSGLIQGNDIKGNAAASSLYPSQYEACQTPSVNAPAGSGLAMIAVNTVQAIGNVVEENDTNLPDNKLTGNTSAIFIYAGNQILLENNIVKDNIGTDLVGLETTYTNGLKLQMTQNLFEDSEPVNLIDSNFSGATSLTSVNNTFYSGAIVTNFGGAIAQNNITMSPPDTPDDFGVAAEVCAGPGVGGFVFSYDDAYWGLGPAVYDCPAGPGDISADPQFVDPANGNFHTKTGSPVIAAGDISVAKLPAADLDGKNRTVCGTVDMGAYEHHPTPPIALSSSPNPSEGGSPVSFTVQLTGNCNTPTGTVTFLDGTAVLGTALLNGTANATFITSALTVGTHLITATYPGDFNFDPSTSNAVTQVVTGYPTATTLQVSPNPAQAFQPISLTGVVSSQFGIPPGTVSFYAGTKLIGSAAVNASGVASTTISTLGAGTDSITAVYNATTQYAQSTSAPVAEVVVGATSSIFLRAAPNSAALGQAILFTATVGVGQSGSTGEPSGTVNFFDSGIEIGSGALTTSRVATFTTSSLAVGSHPLTASYAGGANFNASTSAIVTVIVTTVPTSLVLSGTPNPASLAQAITLMAKASANGVVSIPTGNVTFYDGGTVLGTALLDDSGDATFTTSTLSAGTHPITASLPGGNTFAGSVSPVLDEVVTACDFSLSVNPSSITLPIGGYETLSVTLTPIAGYTGSVQLSCGSMPAHAQCDFAGSTLVSLAEGAKTGSLTINTSDVLGYGEKIGQMKRLAQVPTWPVYTALILPLLGINRRLRSRIRKHSPLLKGFIAGGILLAVFVSLEGCSGKLPGETPAGNYSIQVLGADPVTGLHHATVLSLVVAE